VARRGRKTGITLGIVALIIVALLVVVDLVGRSVAESTIAKKVADEVRTKPVSYSGEPEVSIGGFPFLTQVLSGDYHDITITLHDVKASVATLPSLVVTAKGVHAKASDLMAGHGPVTADTVDGDATVSADSIKQLLAAQNVTATLGEGSVRLKYTRTISGQQISGDATAQIEVANGRARVKVTDLGSTAVQLPDAIKRRLTDALTTDLELPTLPYQLTLRTVRIAPDGLHVAATATNLPVAR